MALWCRKNIIVFCYFRHCSTWASMGECQKNPSWMLMNCKISCGECDNKCTDHNSFCPEWAKLGECKKNPQYMNLYCKKSCKKCQVSHIYFHISMARQTHLSKAPSDLKRKCTLFPTPFSGTVFNALSLGVIHFVRSVSLRNHFLVG